MGDLIRFPGATVDYEFLDAFEWTPELLAEYARERDARHPLRVERPEGRLGRWPRGLCQDCGRVVVASASEVRVCDRDAEVRLRVRQTMDEPPLPDVPGSVSEGARAYRDLWAIPWTAEEAERREAQAKRRRRETMNETTAPRSPGKRLPRYEGRGRAEDFQAPIPPRLMDAMADTPEAVRHAELAQHFAAARERAVKLAGDVERTKADDEKRAAEALGVGGRRRSAPKAERIALDLVVGGDVGGGHERVVDGVRRGAQELGRAAFAESDEDERHGADYIRARCGVS